MGLENIKDKLAKLEPIFKRILTENNVDCENRTQLAVSFHKLPIEQLPEYIQVVDELQKESAIKRYDGKLLTVGSSGTAVSPNRFINAFLNWAVDSGKAMSFEERFASFQNYFSKGTVTRLESCYLYNFRTDLGVVDLPNNIRIRPLTREELKVIEEKAYSPSKRTHFMLERVAELEIQASSTRAGEKKKDNKKFKEAFAHINSAPEAFGHLLNCFHTLKPCGTYVDGTIYDMFEGYAQMIHGGVSRGHINRKPILFGEPFTLSKEELPSIEKYFDFIISKTHKKFALASRRLFFANARNQMEDKILDLCIALEALFLPKSSTELNFRLGMRLGKTLGSDAKKAHEIFEFAKKFYSLRGKVAHGEELPKLIEEDVKRAEELLRQALSMYLADPEQFSDVNFNKALLV